MLNLYRCVFLIMVTMMAGRGFTQNCPGLCEINGPLQTAILATGCAAPAEDKLAVGIPLNELEAVLTSTLEKIRENTDSSFTTEEVQKILDQTREISQRTKGRFDSHAVHHQLEEMRLQVAGLRISKGLVCFNDFVWVLHEAFHPAMHMARHGGATQHYADNDWKDAAASVKRAQKAATVLLALGSDAEEQSHEIVFFIQRIGKALATMDDAIQKKNNEHFRESANSLRTSFLDLVRISE